MASDRAQFLDGNHRTETSQINKTMTSNPCAEIGLFKDSQIVGTHIEIMYRREGIIPGEARMHFFSLLLPITLSHLVYPECKEVLSSVGLIGRSEFIAFVGPG